MKHKRALVIIVDGADVRGGGVPKTLGLPGWQRECRSRGQVDSSGVGIVRQLRSATGPR